MIVTKEVKKITLDYIDTWGKILTSVEWAIKAPHQSTCYASPVQPVFVRDMIFNLTSFIDWHLIHSRKQKQVYQDNIRENRKIIFHDYAVGDQVFVEIKCIIRNLDSPKIGLYTITYVFKNGTVRIQCCNLKRTYKHTLPWTIIIRIIGTPIPPPTQHWIQNGAYLVIQYHGWDILTADTWYKFNQWLTSG